MAKINFIRLYCFGLLLLLVSCSEKYSDTLSSSSADGKNTVKVNGKRVTSFDPYQTNIIINGFNQSDTLITEIFAGDLTNETVKFDWSDNENCVIIFTQQDDSKRNLVINFSENGNSLREINN